MEGAHVSACSNDARNDGIQVPKHLPRGDTQNSKSFVSETCISNSIALRLVAKAVPFAIDLDDEPTF